MRHLVDGDLTANNGGWHVASSDLISGEIAPLERRGYPEPIVNHKQQQARIKLLYAALPRS